MSLIIKESLLDLLSPSPPMRDMRLWPLAEKCGSMVRYPPDWWCMEWPVISKVWGKKMLDHTGSTWEEQLLLCRQHKLHMKQEYDGLLIFPYLSEADMTATQLDAPSRDTQPKFWPPKWNFFFLKTALRLPSILACCFSSVPTPMGMPLDYSVPRCRFWKRGAEIFKSASM